MTILEKEDIYQKWYAEIYEINVNDIDDINLLISLLGDKSQNVLEAACGGGRILVPLAKAGHNVKGFDMDIERLKFIPTKTNGLKNIEYCCLDAVYEDWGSNFDVVVLAGNLLHNIEANIPYDEAQQLFLQKAAASLRIGGHIYLDFGLFAHPEVIFSKNNGRVIFEGTDSNGVYGKQLMFSDGYDVNSQIAYGRRITELILPDGKHETIQQNFAKHIPTLEQVHQWLNASGFNIIYEFGDYNRNPISKDTYRAIIWAEKL